MSLEEDILIERFLRDELSETENKQVLERMISDAEFKEKVLFEQQLFDTLNENSWSFVEKPDKTELEEYKKLFKSKEIKNIKNSIKKANTNFKKKKHFQIKKWHIFSSVAMIAMLISLSILLPGKESNQEIYANYINKSELPSIVNRGNENDFKELYKGQSLFEKKEYLKSAIIFSKELKNTSNSANVYIYLSVSQIELNQFQEAEKTLDLLINSNLIDAEKGYWFKSLLYLKSNQIEKTKKTLSFIIENSHYKKKEAKLLLEEIN
tara:strand:+ start:4116 stop:4913 length:798 start_codon:yes stop_codon:yes gene_type:complete